jgi:hypothetical protein
MMLRKLEGMKLLKVAERGGSCPGHTTVYEIDLSVLAALRAETAARWKAADVAMGAKSAPIIKRRRMGANHAKRGAPAAPNPSIRTINKKRDDDLGSEVLLTPRDFGWVAWLDTMRRQGATELALQIERDGRMVAPSAYPQRGLPLPKRSTIS